MTAIGYPVEEIPAAEASLRFTVDGLEFRLRSGPRGIRFEYPLGPADEEALLRLGSFAAGRLAREDAVLAYDPDDASAFVWQEVPRADDDAATRQVFAQFAASAEWWHDRAEAVSGGKPGGGGASGGAGKPEMIIRP